MSSRSKRPIADSEPAVARLGTVEVGVRRVDELGPAAPLPASDPRLVERIGGEIRRSGPMTFARFMEIALYDPAAGYYASAGADSNAAPTGPAGEPDAERSARIAGPGRRGDFLTAPESHPIFGWTIARRLEGVWLRLDRPDRFVVREHGAGNGALAAGILDGLRRAGSELREAIRYQAIDVAPARLERLGARLEASGLASRLEPADDAPASGAILANELLDALPVHRVEGGKDGVILERFVDLDRSATDPDRPFTTVLGPPSTPALAGRLLAEGVRLDPGQPAEICLALDDWVARATTPLERGELLLIDYGAPASELYKSARGSTLRAYHRHRVHADPLVAIGRQDLTAHVDLTAVERAAVAAGLAPIGHARQADVLAALGIGELLVGLQSEPGTTLESYLAARSAVVRMLDPRATGAFAILAFGRGLDADPPLPGFGPVARS